MKTLTASDIFEAKNKEIDIASISKQEVVGLKRQTTWILKMTYNPALEKYSVFNDIMPGHEISSIYYGESKEDALAIFNTEMVCNNLSF